MTLRPISARRSRNAALLILSVRRAAKLAVDGLEPRRLLATLTVSPAVNASKSTDNENEVDIAVNPVNPLQVFAVANSSSSGLRMSVSSDGGATFTNRLGATGSDGLTAACCDARVAWDSFGNLWMVYLNTSASTLIIARSGNGGATFANFKTYSGSWDNPSITVGNNNTLWVLATASGGQAAIGTQITGANTTGAFVGPVVISGTSSGGFGDIAVGNDGSVVVSFQNNTGTTTAADAVPLYRDADGLGAGGFSLITTIPTNVGGFDGIPAQSARTIDSEPNFAVIPAGKPHAGRIFLTYTDELVNESNDTNVMLRSSDNNGLTWSAPTKVNDDATTRSQFLQSIAVDNSTGAVGLFWYDARNDVGTATGGFSDTTANNEAQIYSAFSIDGGDNWLPNTVLQAAVSKASGAGSPTDYGDWTGADFAGGLFYAGYTDNSNGGLTPANASRPKLDMAVSKVAVNTTPITGLAGTVYDDANANGLFDGSESGLAGVTVFLDANSNGSLDGGETSTVTLGGGSYSFSGLIAGSYNVTVVAAAGRRAVVPASGTQVVTIATDQFAAGKNFGLTAAVSLGGNVYDDVNASGVRDAGEPAIAGARVYIDSNNNGSYDNSTQTFNSTNVPVTISATGTPTVTSTLSVPATLGQVSKLTVALNITHTFDGDLVLTIIAPDGTRIPLVQNSGGSGDNFTNTVFDDAAATAITSGTAPFNGTYRPAVALGGLIGKAASGTWTLEVADTANTDGGTLNSWSLTISSVETSTLTDGSGNYTFPALAAGSYTLRQVLTPAGYGFTNPSTGVYNVVAPAAAVLSFNFGSRDIDRPLLNTKQFDVDAPVPSVRLTFSEDVVVDPADLTLTNLTTSAVVPSSNLAVSFDSATDVATVTFPGFPGGILPDADYRLSVAGSVHDTGGKLLANPGSVDFFTLAGDFNRDRSVNFSDLLLLAQNYGTTGKVFTQGNADYDAAGGVNFADLLILAQNYNRSLPVAPASIATSLITPPGKRNDDEGSIAGTILA